MNIEAFKAQANQWGESRTPFLFLIDFEMEKPVICRLDEAAENGLWFDIRGYSNYVYNDIFPSPAWTEEPVDFAIYRAAFNQVQKAFQEGDTYLLNLTFPSVLRGELQLEGLFNSAKASYKLLKKDDFVLYSPECFVRISDNEIRSFPMKGTIDANVRNAEQLLLSNEKELFEHNTIVDLIRNDLAMVASRIAVDHFRYVDRISRPKGDLLQVSSEISGQLGDFWQNRVGDILTTLLPAGSVSGAPKQRTCEIIRDAEGQKRGYYTGIFGVFDGETLDSAVNIRYVEQYKDGEFCYRSGGGITALSDYEEEYWELIDKIYVPTA